MINMQCGLDMVLGEVPTTSWTAQKSWSAPGGPQSSLSPGLRMSSIFRIILTTWVANKICCFLPIRVSTTCCCFMSVWEQKAFDISVVPHYEVQCCDCRQFVPYHWCCCADSRCRGRSCSLWPVGLWPLSWSGSGSVRCSQPVPLGLPPGHLQTTSWHTAPMMGTRKEEGRDEDNESSNLNSIQKSVP